MTFKHTEMDAIKELAETEFVEEIRNVLPQDVFKHVVNVLSNEDSKLSEENTLEWLQWCQRNSKVKIVASDVPHGILPLGYSVKLHDGRVLGGSGGYGPDDKIYNNDEEIRDRVARGNTVLEIHQATSGKTSHDMAVFALKKFTGGMGDEDEDQPENDLVWQRYFLKPIEEVKKVVCMVKENGEAAHVSVRLIGGKFFFIAGSKNVHLLFQTQKDIDLYTESRFMVAKTVGEAWLRQMEAMDMDKLALFLNFMNLSKFTAIFEILCPDYQHVVDLSYLKEPKLKFLTMTAQYSKQDHDQGISSLSALPPDACIEFARILGLDTANYENIPATESEKRMNEIRTGYGYEGEVMYFLDENDATVGLLKKKTAWYIICRAIREKVSNASSTYKKNPGGWTKQLSNSHLARIDKRIDEIRKWLELSDAEAQKWKVMGKDFQNWLISSITADVNNMDKFPVRGKFPQLWNSFLTGINLSDEMVNVEEESKQEDLQTQPQEKFKIEEARTTSPSVYVESKVSKLRPYIATCIVRSVDLLGRNMKKLLAGMQKTHGKVCKDRKLATIGLHDLRKVKESKLVYTAGNPAITPIGYSEKFNIEGLINNKIEPVMKYKHLLEGLEGYPFIKDGETVISLPPLLNCDETKISEETEDILIEITSDKDEETVNYVLGAIILQIYHMGIGLNNVGKYIHIEKGRVVHSDGTEHLYPSALPCFK
eukprot:GFUD01012836.1.p1 GENE.GFUD01012836.1~~GFUD01012836.1.p1  ORF type:complete len:710 (+),score=159.73 GFUD01012836.1:83-2212(+)